MGRLMLPVATHPWQPPLDFAAPYAGENIALLHSARPERFSGRHSFLFRLPQQVWEGREWGELPELPANDDGLPYAIGHLAYELGDDVPESGPAPCFRLTRYAHCFRFDHEAKTIEEFVIPGLSRAPAPLSPQPGGIPGQVRDDISIQEITSNFTRAHYEQAVRDTLEQIGAGNFYQANLTRKFFGQFAAAPDYFALFRRLCASSPAAFSAYIRHGAQAVLSSSPESFLSVENGSITSRPIKGSAPRGADAASDESIRIALQASEKNQAENLMIVDLMRHDLAQVSQPGSVQVAEQSGLYSYPTIHHLVSTVTARKLPDKTVYDVVRACFPPGSMTGAPKRAAIRWCAAQESLPRGIYSGALGWFGGGGRCDLSVVIRTLVCEGDRFEFQVGGGIVADSSPEDEWRETLIKARGIARALGIEEERLAAL